MRKIDFKLLVVAVLLFLSGCKQSKKYHDTNDDKLEVDATDKLAAIVTFQKKINKEYADPETSPLPDRYRKDFESLDFFEPDTNYVVMARLERTPNALPFMMSTTTDRQTEEVVFGVLYFKLFGEDYQLELYQNQELMLEEGFEDYLFLPFLDETNGVETYAAGRYMDLRIPETNEVLLDFNTAYNPYCAYNKKYSCPLVPKINTLPIPIKAGVKAFKK